jgi:cytosine deaminase
VDRAQIQSEVASLTIAAGQAYRGARMTELVVRNARLLDRVGVVDLAADEGRWSRIGPDLALTGERELDAEGRLVTPPLVDCHLHLDAVLTAGRPRYNGSGTLIEGIQVWGELKESLTVDDVYARAKEVVRWSVAQGTLFIRAHADVSTRNEAPLRGLIRLRDELADLVTIQVTAFPQDGIYSKAENDELLERALELGADCVGGIPHYEPSAELGLREVHRVFELAARYGRRIDVHCDETDDPASRYLEVMADNTVRHGLSGRVTASHCTAMGSYEPYYSSKLHGFLRRAGINIVVNPFANSLVQGRLDVYPKRRGFAQLKELLAAGVNVSLGNDVVMDPWYLLGRADMVEAASLALHFTYMSGLDEIPELLRCATDRGARTLGIEDEYGLELGKPADCVIFDAPTPLEVLRLHPPRRWVIRRGQIIAETEPSRTSLLGEPVTFAPALPNAGMATELTSSAKGYES